MNKIAKEFFKQAKYDFITAEAMYKTARYLYAVFMCHLSLEKAAKGLYNQILNEVPPKNHDLLLLFTKMKIELPVKYNIFIDEINKTQIITRYPAELSKAVRTFTKAKSFQYLISTKEALQWIKEQLNESLD